MYEAQIRLSGLLKQTNEQKQELNMAWNLKENIL